MSASINMKTKNLGMDFLKQTAGYISGGAKEYFEKAMPVTTSTLSEAKRTTSAVSAAFVNTSQSVFPKMKQLRTQVSFRGITNWFMEREEQYGGGSSDSELNFDIQTDGSEIAEAQISELGRNANQISSAVVESSHRMVESQLAATANLMATAEKQTAVLAAGFDKTNETLSKILEVLTKNTSTLIETTVAANSKKSANDSMLGSGRFNLTEYKKIVSGNFKNSEMGMMASFLPLLSGDSGLVKQMLSPGNIVSMMMSGAINKASPNLKKNLGALDQAVNDTIMSSLIRLGNNRSYGPGGGLARMLGIDSTRKDTNTSRSTLELKTVPFDSIAHESLTNAIPGYLRKILVAVGGEDTVYDYRSRSFRSKGSIRKDFRETAATKGTLYGATGNIRNAVGTDEFSSMIYDMMMTELGSRTAGGSATRTVRSFGNKDSAEDYIVNQLLAKMKLSGQELNAARRFAGNLGRASSGSGASDMITQAAKNNVQRNNRMKSYVDNANAYNVDLSDISDGLDYDLNNIAASYGKRRKSGGGSASVRTPSGTNLNGVNYTNVALFEIYRKLNKGINVFQVGSSRTRRDPFKESQALQKPQTYKPKPIIESSVGGGLSRSSSSGISGEDEDNLLRNNQQEDGTSENLTRGQRFSRWGKKRGGLLRDALFSGSPEQVRDAFSLMFNDVTQVAGDGIKKGAAKINAKSGNFTGYLKHKITGAGYEYTDDNGEKVVIDKNQKGGVLGYFDELVFGEGGAKGLGKRMVSTGSKWFKSVAGYFNYGGQDKDERSVAGKRKNIIGTSVGAMLGMGLLGGPLGIIMGGVAGSAMSQTDGLGSKIKNLLFGDKDHEGDSKKDRNKRRGLIHRAVDGIVDPIRFQIGKTMTSFGSVLKKNILGPLSNIGYAIKDRMANAAGGVVSKVFGKIFGGAFNMLKKVVMLPLSIAKAPINAIGGLTRGVTEGGGAVAGGLLNLIASGLVRSDEGKATLKQRRAGQKNDAAGDRARSGFYGKYELDENGDLVMDSKGRPKKLKGKSYKTWKEDQERQRDRRGTIDDYTAERRLTKEEIEAAEATKRTAENTSRLAENQESLSSAVIGEIIPGSSFKSHDAGVHDRLDQLIQIFTGRISKGKIKTRVSGNVSGVSNDSEKVSSEIKKSSESSDIDSFASGAIGATASFVSGDADTTNDESRIATSIFDEAGKKNASKSSISTKLKNLMGIQKKKKEGEGEEKKKSLFERIFDTVKGGFGQITDLLGPIGVAVGGILGSSELKSFWNDVVKGDMNFSEWWGEKSLIGKGVNGMMDISKFIGSVGGPIVNGVSNGIATLTKMIPFMPTITPPQINTTGPFAGLATGMLGGLYLKGASALGSIASAAASLISAGSNALGSGKGLGKYAGLAGGALAIGGSLYGWSQGGYKHENTDAAGNEIIDQTKQGAFDSTSLKYIGHSTMGTISPISGKSSMTGKYFMPNGGSVFSAASPAAPITSMTSATGKAMSKVGDDWIFTETGRKAAASSVAKATPNVSTVANAADSKGALGFVKKALEGIKSFLMKNKAFKAFSETIGKKIDDMISSIVKGGQSIFQKAANKVVGIITRGTVKEASSAATLGIGYAVMAFGGALSGGLSAANIFGVREQDVNGTMRTIASVIVAMLNGVPGLWALELADLVLQPLLGINVRSFLCSLLYGLLGGGDDLEGKQGTFSEDVGSYNQQYGAQLSTEEYNDLTNKGMFTKIFGKGSVKTDESGRAMFDDAGNALRTNHGVSGWFAGGENQYVKDSNGAVVKDDSGKAIQAMDKEGHTLKKNMTWTDNVGNWFHDVGGFFGGKTTYKTDENGVAIIGDDGKAVVESKEENIFQRGGAAISDWWGGKEIMGPDGKMTKTTGFAEAAQKTLGGIGSAIAKPFQDTGSAIAKWWGGSEELDENGKPILDENGNPVKKGGFKSWAANGLGKFSSTAGNLIRGVTTPVQELLMGEYERDENGNPVLDENNQPIRKGGLAGWVKSGLGKLNTSFVEPAKEMVKGAVDWVSTKAEWIADGASSAKDWIVGKATSMWKSVSEPVKDFANGAKSWISDKANWLGDKAKDVGGWISDKASSAWKSISEPAKDMAIGAADWVSKKAAWISDKAKNAKDWIVENTGKLFGSITDNVKGLVDGASTWVKEKAAWVKDGVKDVGDWIGEKATSIWDWITGGIDKIADKGEQSKRDEEYIKNHQGTGGASIGGVGGVSEPHSANESAPTSKSATSTITEGGNPVNLPTKISSGYGYRDIGAGVEFHKGIDLVPTINGDAEVGARFAGKVVDVKSNIPNTHTGLNVGSNLMGNFVKIDTSSGKRITYMHLAENSIPSTIKKGSNVSIGDKIGIMGTTGRSTGRHLHYQFNDISSGNPIDPTSSIYDGANMSAFNTVSNTASGAEGFPDTYVDTSQSVSETGESSNGLSGFLDGIKKVGMNFLDLITGGIFRKTSKETGSSEIQYDIHGMSTGTSGNMGLVDGPVELLSTKQVAAIQSHREKKEIIDLTTGKSFFVSWAASPSYHSDWTPMTPDDVKTIWSFLHPNGGGNMKNKDDWSWNARPGVLKLNGRMIACGFHLRPHAAIMGGNPGAPFSNQSNTKPAGGWPLGGHMCMYYGDSPGGTPKCNDAAREAYALGNKFFKAQADSINASSVGTASTGNNGTDTWNLLNAKLNNDYATAGIMGNLEHESGMWTDRVQGDTPRSSKSSNYAASVDSGKIPATDFINKGPGGGGFGLAQWTYPSRKRGLLDFVKSRGVSIANRPAQVDYLYKELGEYGLLNKLQSASSVKAASNIILHEFEKPANQSASVENTRAGSGQSYYNQHAGKSSSTAFANSALSASQSIPGIGGDSTSELGSSKYVTRSMGNRPVRGNHSVINRLSGPFTSADDSYDKSADQYVAGTPTVITNHIESLLVQVINELRSINNNTGTSSNLLGSLNEKGFVDKGLRDSMTAVAKSQKNTGARHAQSNPNNVRTVASLARP